MRSVSPHPRRGPGLAAAVLACSALMVVGRDAAASPAPAAAPASATATGCLTTAVHDGLPVPDVQSWLEAVSTTPPVLNAPDGTARNTSDSDVADVLARDEARRQAAAALAATPGATEVRDAAGELIAAVHTRPAARGGVLVEQLVYWLPGSPCPR
jgi:hypothetical protein